MVEVKRKLDDVIFEFPVILTNTEKVAINIPKDILKQLKMTGIAVGSRLFVTMKVDSSYEELLGKIGIVKCGRKIHISELREHIAGCGECKSEYPFDRSIVDYHSHEYKCGHILWNSTLKYQADDEHLNVCNLLDSF